MPNKKSPQFIQADNVSNIPEKKSEDGQYGAEFNKLVSSEVSQVMQGWDIDPSIFQLYIQKDLMQEVDVGGQIKEMQDGVEEALKQKFSDVNIDFAQQIGILAQTTDFPDVPNKADNSPQIQYPTDAEIQQAMAGKPGDLKILEMQKLYKQKEQAHKQACGKLIQNYTVRVEEAQRFVNMISALKSIQFKEQEGLTSLTARQQEVLQKNADVLKKSGPAIPVVNLADGPPPPPPMQAGPPPPPMAPPAPVVKKNPGGGVAAQIAANKLKKGNAGQQQEQPKKKSGASPADMMGELGNKLKKQQSGGLSIEEKLAQQKRDKAAGVKVAVPSLKKVKRTVSAEEISSAKEIAERDHKQAGARNLRDLSALQRKLGELQEANGENIQYLLDFEQSIQILRDLDVDQKRVLALQEPAIQHNNERTELLDQIAKAKAAPPPPEVQSEPVVVEMDDNVQGINKGAPPPPAPPPPVVKVNKGSPPSPAMNKSAPAKKPGGLLDGIRQGKKLKKASDGVGAKSSERKQSANLQEGITSNPIFLKAKLKVDMGKVTDEKTDQSIALKEKDVEGQLLGMRMEKADAVLSDKKQTYEPSKKAIALRAEKNKNLSAVQAMQVAKVKPSELDELREQLKTAQAQQKSGIRVDVQPSAPVVADNDVILHPADKMPVIDLSADIDNDSPQPSELSALEKHIASQAEKNGVDFFQEYKNSNMETWGAWLSKPFSFKQSKRDRQTDEISELFKIANDLNMNTDIKGDVLKAEYLVLGLQKIKAEVIQEGNKGGRMYALCEKLQDDILAQIKPMGSLQDLMEEGNDLSGRRAGWQDTENYLAKVSDEFDDAKLSIVDTLAKKHEFVADKPKQNKM